MSILLKLGSIDRRYLPKANVEVVSFHNSGCRSGCNEDLGITGLPDKMQRSTELRLQEK